MAAFSGYCSRRSFLRRRSIPVDVYSAIEDHGVHMRLAAQEVRLVGTKSDDLMRCFEVPKAITCRSLHRSWRLEAEANDESKFREFIPAEKIDALYFESSYLAPQKGAESLNRLLAETLEKTGALP